MVVLKQNLIIRKMEYMFQNCITLKSGQVRSSSGKALGYGLDGPGVGGVEIFLRSFVSRLVLGSTQSPIKMSTGSFMSPGAIGALSVTGLIK